MRKVVIIIIALVVCGAAYSVVQKTNKKNPYAFVYQVDVELLVDGKPMTLSKQAGCLVENYSKAGGDKFGYVKPSGLAVSKELASGEVVIAAVPSGCKRFRKVATGDPENPVKYEISRPLAKDFLPMLAIADKTGVPDALEMYASSHAYAAPAARLKLKSINMKALAPGTDFDGDPFDWLLKSGHKGPVYVGFAARKSYKIAGMDELFDKHIPQREGVVRLDINNPEHLWFQRYFNGIYGTPATDNSKKREELLPRSGIQVVGQFARGQDVRPSQYGGQYIGFKMDEGQNMFDKTPVTVRYYPEKNGIINLYRANYKANDGGGHFTDDYADVTYVFPSGEEYETSTKVLGLLMYDAKSRELYRRVPLGLLTHKITGLGLDEYNKPEMKIKLNVDFN
jgi:hypothetical protein